MDRTEDTRRLAREIYEGLARGERRMFLERLHEDVVMTVPGTSSWSGTYRGRDAFFDVYIGRLRRHVVSGIGRLVPTRILADGDWAVVECDNDLTLEDGSIHRNRYCMLIRFEEGMIVELQQNFDTAAREAALGRFDD